MLEEESMAIAPPRMLQKAMAAPAGAPMAMAPPPMPHRTMCDVVPMTMAAPPQAQMAMATAAISTAPGKPPL